MKNALKLTVVATALFGGLVACNDAFLDTPPQAALSNATLASGKNGVDATLIAAYRSLNGWTQNWNESAWGAAPSNWVFDNAGDDVHKGSEPGDGDAMLAYELFQWNPSDGDLRSKFIATYEGIARSNSAINTASEFLANNPDEAEYANGVIGQATFLRGYYHFEAYKVWKKAPYYFEDDVDFQKANDQEMLPLIIADFEKAAGMVADDRGGDVGRADKMVVTAYLGKAKMFAGDYAGALSAFNTVINSGRYSLADCFYDNFSVAGDNNSESIFAVQNSVNDGDADGGNSNFSERLALPHGASPYGCCGFKTPSYDLAFAYKVDANGLPISTVGQSLDLLAAGDASPVDPRLDFTIGRTGVPYLDWGNHEDSWVRGQGYMGWYSPKKNGHAQGDASLSGSWSGAQLSNLNVELMRYSDLLLMAAEAEVEVGSLEKAREYVNMVRARAGNCAQGSSAIAVDPSSAEITWATYQVGTYDSPWSDKDAARNAVRTERRLELALEGHRFFDLQRWGQVENVLGEYLPREAELVTVLQQAQTPAAKHYAFPLPNTEIERSGGNLVQNTGF
ncbi:RagB/SusD family nutrient uptake outer membrane protein [Jiulongibacter sp. NS-SX5]|uniref:RagB/SusD family nutrient uptake outer membrane protein n=1 Tax=Jiulongibacter sp. NS-SX5 TaxID=3463854 RepID=UPI004059C5BE